MATVWVTSGRIARLNVIAAIRDLPQPRRAGRATRQLVAMAAGMVSGAYFTVVGIARPTPALVVVGPPLAVACLAGLVARRLPGRIPLAVAATVSIAWCIGVFSLLPDAMEGSTINVFLLQGIILVGAAVSMVTAFAHEASVLVRRVSRGGGALRARLMPQPPRAD